MSIWEQLKKQFCMPTEPKQPNPVPKQILNLTPRELEVFRLLLEGYTLKETAQQLGIKYSTTNTHMMGIYKKLGVSSRAELIIRYHDFEKEEQK